MIISFAWTTEALLQGLKTVTRRKWKTSTVLSLQAAYDRGKRVHSAWDKMPFAGGKHVSLIGLTERPYMEKLRDMPESDLRAEGGLWASLKEFVELMGGDPDEEVLVIRFELVDLLVDRDDPSFAVAVYGWPPGFAIRSEDVRARIEQLEADRRGEENECLQAS